MSIRRLFAVSKPSIKPVLWVFAFLASSYIPAYSSKLIFGGFESSRSGFSYLAASAGLNRYSGQRPELTARSWCRCRYSF